MAETTTPPRSANIRRWFRISCRTVHILTIAVLVGGHYFDTPAASLRPWLYGVIASGGILMATDVISSLHYLREVRGAAIVFKMAMVASVAWLWDHRVPILFAVIVLSGIVSHMPGRFRYWVVVKLPGRKKAKHPQQKANEP